MSALIATLCLGIPTLLLAVHAIRVAIEGRAGYSGGSDVPLIDLRAVGLGFAVCVVSVAVGRQLASHPAIAGPSLASLFTFCVAIAWGLWAQGARSHQSSTVILLGSAVAAGLLGLTAPSW
jgi:hypothetical protein